MRFDSTYAQIRTAKVFLRGVEAGMLQKSEDGFTFAYSIDWIQSGGTAMALSMPLTQKPYQAPTLFPFFDNLIPEGWLLSYVQQVHRVDKTDRFALLMITGRFPIGAISVVPVFEGTEISHEMPELTADERVEVPISHPIAAGICIHCLHPVKGRVMHPKCAQNLWGTTRKLRMMLHKDEPWEVFRQTVHGASISGAQRKGLFQLDKGVLKPGIGYNAQWILKPQGSFESLPENEHVTMCIAKAIGFDVPAFGMVQIPRLGWVFVNRRFDCQDDSVVRRMEDFGQLLGYPSDMKYRGTYNQIANCIQRHSDAVRIDVIEFWKRLVFAFFIGNGDMHLKNWAMLEQTSLNGCFRLSPCYDFLNTRLPLPKEQFELALPLDARQNRLNRKRFLEFADRLNITEFANKVLAELPKWLEITERLVSHSLLPAEKKERYLEIVHERYQRLIDVS